LALNFNPWAQFQTFRQLTPSSFRSIPTLIITRISKLFSLKNNVITSVDRRLQKRKILSLTHYFTYTLHLPYQNHSLYIDLRLNASCRQIGRCRRHQRPKMGRDMGNGTYPSTHQQCSLEVVLLVILLTIIDNNARKWPYGCHCQPSERGGG